MLKIGDETLSMQQIYMKTYMYYVIYLLTEQKQSLLCFLSIRQSMEGRTQKNKKNQRSWSKVEQNHGENQEKQKKTKDLSNYGEHGG